MNVHRPDIFISATTADLGRARSVVKEALLTIGAHPVEQTTFPPDYRVIKEMLRAKIMRCDAVIHLIGRHYGSEPAQRTEWETRRSYTQLEYDVARELGKPVYTFITADDYPADALPEEDAEKRALQQAHRDSALRSDRARYIFTEEADLDKQVRALQTQIEKLERALKRDRRHFAWIAGGTLLLLLVIGWLVVELPARLRPKHDHVIEAPANSLTPLAEKPLTFDETVDTRFSFQPGGLTNGTPVTILDRGEAMGVGNRMTGWVELEVVSGSDKGRRGWTLANRVKRIQ